jgi:ribonuclease HII
MAREPFDPALLPAAPDLSFETRLWAAGALRLAGIDEAGRGALAGPVSAGAVILPPDGGMIRALSGVRDSKQMTPAQRAFWAGRIRQHALAWAVGFAEAWEIDAIGILPATRLAAQRALEGLNAGHLLLDWLFLPHCALPQTALVKGDRRSLSIAAASVLAKTARDEIMLVYAAVFPGYGFAAHKGYGTAAHRAALAVRGPCAIHRRTFTLK